MNPGFTKHQTSSNWLSGGKCSSGYCASLRSFWTFRFSGDSDFLGLWADDSNNLSINLSISFQPRPHSTVCWAHTWNTRPGSYWWRDAQIQELSTFFRCLTFGRWSYKHPCGFTSSWINSSQLKTMLRTWLNWIGMFWNGVDLDLHSSLVLYFFVLPEWRTSIAILGLVSPISS